MFALILQTQSLAGGMRYGMWAPPGYLEEPDKGYRSGVMSGFTECPSRACKFSGIFAEHGRLSGELKVRAPPIATVRAERAAPCLLLRRAPRPQD
jgi:hypothetical protein